MSSSDSQRSALRLGMKQYSPPRAFLLDCVALPVAVWSLVVLLSVREDYAIGLLLVGIASAGPLGIKASELARADVPFAITLVAVLEATNALVIPAWIALLLPPGASEPISPVVSTLVLLVLCPLAVGLGPAPTDAEARRPLGASLDPGIELGNAVVIALVVIRYLPGSGVVRGRGRTGFSNRRLGRAGRRLDQRDFCETGYRPSPGSFSLYSVTRK